MAKLTSQLGLLVSAIFLSAISLIYELSYCKIISKFTGNAVIWESLGMGAFLLGMGVGSFILDERKEKNEAPDLSTVQFILSLFGLTFPVMIYLCHILYRINYFDGGLFYLEDGFQRIYVFGAFSLLFPFLIGLFSGMELPLLLDKAKFKNSFPILMGCYYFGALIATLAFQYVLKSSVSDIELGIFAAFINFIFFIKFRYENKSFSMSNAMPVLILLSLAVYVSLFSKSLEMTQIKNFYHNRLSFTVNFKDKVDLTPKVPFSELDGFLTNKQDVERYRSFYHDIDLVKYEEDGVEGFNVYIDGRFQFGSESDKEYHEYMAHIPIMLNYAKIPKKVLVLGGGDGILAKELLRHKDLKSLRLVDIDKKMLDLAKNHPLFLKMNGGSFFDKRVELISEDAFSFLRNHNEKYDAVYMDFTFPFSFDVARLYSVEFLSGVAKVLSEEGIFVHSTPFPFSYGDHYDVNYYDQLISSTYQVSGLKSLLMYTDPQNSFIVASTKNRKWKSDFNDLNLSYKTSLSSVFNEKKHRLIKVPVREDMVNSLFKPKFMGFHDFLF